MLRPRLELSYTTVRSPISGRISERNVDLSTLVGPGGKSLLATIVKSDTVLIDFSMTSLDYLKSRERNVELGERDSSRSWQPYVTITLADNTVYLRRGLVDFAEPQSRPEDRHILRTRHNAQSRACGAPPPVYKGKDIARRSGGRRSGSCKVAYRRAWRKLRICDATFGKSREAIWLEIGPEVDNRVVIERGLVAGEMVVVEGQHKLSPGMEVTYKTEEGE